MHLKNLIILLSFIALISAEELAYKKVIHNTDPQAKCLDGTSPAIYVHEGGDQSKFLLFFMGGGYCKGKTLGQVLESCFDRSQTDVGSSDPWPQQFVSKGGYLSTDPEISRFANWTKIIILYCDGALHQGYNQFPVSFRGVSLYFRGQKNVKSHLKWITNTYNFQSAQKVVLTGASAGGVATFLWSNYVRSLLTNPQAFYAIADSGVFMNATDPYTGQYQFSQKIFQLYRISNTDAFTPITTCNKKFQGEEFKCLFAENLFTSIEGRMLVLNSEYDEVAIEDGMNIRCLKRQQKIPFGKSLLNCSTQQMQYIEDYRTQYLQFLGKFMQFSKNNVWSISCCAHSFACYRERYAVDVVKVPGIEGLTVKDAVESFVFEDERISSIDEVSWPDNGPCAY